MTGYGQKAAVFADRIRNEFIASELRPPDACTEVGTKSPLDRRRWEGRGASACLRGYKDILRQCNQFYKMRKSVEAMNLPGNPSDMDLYRITMAMFNGFLKPSPTPALCTEIIKNPDYVVGKPFKYMSCYKYLMGKPVIKGVHGMDIMKTENNDAPAPEGEVEVSEDITHGATPGPISGKSVKRLKRSSSLVADGGVEKRARGGNSGDEAAPGKSARSLMELKLEEQQLQLEWYRAAFQDPKANVPPEEMEKAGKLMRAAFFEMFAGNGVEREAPSNARADLADMVQEHSLLAADVRAMENGTADRVMHLEAEHHA